MSAESRGWGPGWPNCQRSNIVTIKRSDGLRLPVHRGIAELVAYLIDETERRGYDVVPGWTWGFACRAIRGSQSPSNHSWGLAVDINAPKNPMGSRLITDMPGWMPELWKAHMFRWGGEYRSRPDAMHYEFMGTPADARRITEDIRRRKNPGSGGIELPIKQTTPFTRSDTVILVQAMANDWARGFKPEIGQLTEDGVYGPVTAFWIHGFKEWVIALQKAFGLPQWPNSDTQVGPVTFGGLQFWANAAGAVTR